MPEKEEITVEDKSSIDVDWAEIIDIFASEYGWTIEEICKLDMGQVVALIKQIRARYQAQQPDSQGLPNVPNVNKDNEEMPISDFVNKMGGKFETDEDGTKRIVL